MAPAPGDQGKASIASDGKNGVWLAWVDNRYSSVGLYVQNIGADGSRLQGDSGRLIADQLSKVSTPQIVTLSSAKAAIVWVNRPKKDQWDLYWTIIDASPVHP